MENLATAVSDQRPVSLFRVWPVRHNTVWRTWLSMIKDQFLFSVYDQWDTVQYGELGCQWSKTSFSSQYMTSETQYSMENLTVNDQRPVSLFSVWPVRHNTVWRTWPLLSVIKDKFLLSIPGGNLKRNLFRIPSRISIRFLQIISLYSETFLRTQISWPQFSQPALNKMYEQCWENW